MNYRFCTLFSPGAVFSWIVCMLKDISVKKFFQVCNQNIHEYSFFFFFIGSRNEDGSPVDKPHIMLLLLRCRDSHTHQSYNANREALMEYTNGLWIRPGRVKHEVSFQNYYDVNWEGIQPMWVLAFRKKLPLQVNMLILSVCKPPITYKFVSGLCINTSCGKLL